MTGLDKILKSIDKEAQTLSSEAIKKAKCEAKDILSNAKKVAQKEANLIIKNAEDEAKNIIKRADSQIELQEREMLLKAKREQIDYIIKEAKNTLCSLPDNKYFDVILKLCEKYIKPQKCNLIFSSYDLERLPKGFKSKLSKLAKSVGGEIKISEKARDIDRGFILSYGDIEENCTFDCLFNEAYDLLCDKVNDLLFS